jgi:hypothetical protein
MVCFPSPSPSLNKAHARNTRTRTHIRLGILVGAGIQQQPRAVRTTNVSGPNQSRPSVLRAPPPMSENVAAVSRQPLAVSRRRRICKEATQVNEKN